MDGEAEDLSVQKALADLEIQTTERAHLIKRCSHLCPSPIPRRHLNSHVSSFNTDTKQNTGFHEVAAFPLQEVLFWGSICARQNSFMLLFFSIPPAPLPEQPYPPLLQARQPRYH